MPSDNQQRQNFSAPSYPSESGDDNHLYPSYFKLNARWRRLFPGYLRLSMLSVTDGLTASAAFHPELMRTSDCFCHYHWRKAWFLQRQKTANGA